MSDLAALFAAAPVLQDRANLELQEENDRLRAELRDRNKITITLCSEEAFDEGREVQRGRIVAEGNLQDAEEPIEKPEQLSGVRVYNPATGVHHWHNDLKYQVVRLTPVNSFGPISAELFCDYETRIEIRLGPRGLLLGSSTAEGGEGFCDDDWYKRLYCDCTGYSDDDFNYGSVDGSRRFDGISYKYIPKEGVEIPTDREEQREFMMHLADNNFTAEFDALYLALEPEGGWLSAF